MYPRRIAELLQAYEHLGTPVFQSSSMDKIAEFLHAESESGREDSDARSEGLYHKLRHHPLEAFFEFEGHFIGFVGSPVGWIVLGSKVRRVRYE